jgi:hypothetical protein
MRKIEKEEERGTAKEKCFFSLPSLYADPNKHRSQREDEEKKKKPRMMSNYS